MKSLSTTLLTAAVIALSACAKKNDDSNKLDTNAIKASAELTTEQKADRLADAAERLLPTSSALYAEDVVEAALALNPANPKARLIKAILAPSLELKGILARIEPLVKTNPADYADYQKMVRDLQKYNPEKAYTKFLLDGQADIHTEREAQEVVARVIARIDDLRKTLRSLRDTEMTFYINVEDFKQKSFNDAINGCQAVETSPGVYELKGCSPADAYERRANGADFEALEDVVAGYQVYLTVLNAWDLTGVYTQKSQLNGGTDHDLKILFANGAFGTLRAENGMGVVPDIVKDAVLGIRRAQALQSQLCPAGFEMAQNRPGYIFDRGFCVTSSTALERTLSALELMLQGQAALVPMVPGKPDVRVNAITFFSQPIRDLRTLEPITTNACGNVTSVGDSTLGGVFPDGDFNRILVDDCHRRGSVR